MCTFWHIATIFLILSVLVKYYTSNVLAKMWKLEPLHLKTAEKIPRWDRKLCCTYSFALYDFAFFSHYFFVLRWVFFVKLTVISLFELILFELYLICWLTCPLNIGPHFKFSVMWKYRDRRNLKISRNLRKSCRYYRKRCSFLFFFFVLMIVILFFTNCSVVKRRITKLAFLSSTPVAF